MCEVRLLPPPGHTKKSPHTHTHQHDFFTSQGERNLTAHAHLPTLIHSRRTSHHRTSPRSTTWHRGKFWTPKDGQFTHGSTTPIWGSCTPECDCFLILEMKKHVRQRNNVENGAMRCGIDFAHAYCWWK